MSLAAVKYVKHKEFSIQNMWLYMTFFYTFSGAFHSELGDKDDVEA